MPAIMDGETYKYVKPTKSTLTYKPKVVKPVKPTSYYREEPYDNSGALAEAERRRLIAEAEARRQAQAIAEAQARAAEKARLQAQTDKRQASGYMQVGGGTYLNPTDMWNSYKTAQTKAQASFGGNWESLKPAYANAGFNINNILRSVLGYAPLESWQNPNSRGGTTYSPGYSGGYAGQTANMPNYNVNVAPGWAEDWNMSNMGTIANRFGGGQLDRANWGGSINNPYGGTELDPYWLSRGVYAPLGADPNSFDPYDPAGSPYVYAEDTVIPETYGGGGGYGGGGYSFSPGYYGQNSNYGAKWYENLLQWNI